MSRVETSPKTCYHPRAHAPRTYAYACTVQRDCAPCTVRRQFELHSAHRTQDHRIHRTLFIVLEIIVWHPSRHRRHRPWQNRTRPIAVALQRGGQRGGGQGKRCRYRYSRTLARGTPCAGVHRVRTHYIRDASHILEIFWHPSHHPRHRRPAKLPPSRSYASWAYSMGVQRWWPSRSAFVGGRGEPIDGDIQG